jgi:preprotein translocase subunit SecA
MFNAFIKRVFGTKHERQMKRMQPLIDRINALEPKMRALGMRHYDVPDDRRASCLHQGKIAEMRTGEGKTLTRPRAVPERAGGQGRPPDHGQRLPGRAATPSGWARSTASSG